MKHEAAVVAAGDEADILAIGLCRVRQAEISRDRSRLVLLQPAQRELDAR
jgi:hypothetical protein